MMILKILKGIFLTFTLCIALSSCSNKYPTALDGSAGPLVIYPDYKEVTIPVNIAPLNFHYALDGAEKAVTTFSLDNKTVRIKGMEVEWPAKKWKSFISGAEGKTIEVKSELTVGGNPQSEIWHIYVSEDSIDGYLTYRLIEPSFQMFHEISIEERCIENFEESTVCSHAVTDNACMNCHIHAQQRGELSMFYIRGPKGGAILNRNGELRKLTLNAEGLLSGTVYGEIHPSGRYGVFSTNIILPSLHAVAHNRMEVYDSASDLTVADFDSNRMINSENVSRADKLETFPCFSADGEYVYYCIADTVSLPSDIENLKYSLVRAAFDPSDGSISEQVDTIWSASEHNSSVCHPKASPDGRWIMFTVSDYGTFPIDHRESTLKMIDLETGEINDLAGVKKDESGSDTYHSWSANGRWFVFASKRGDGLFAKPYFCHLDADGNPSKPFVLPQKSSRFYELNLKSFNVPDLGSASIGISLSDSRRMFKTGSEAFK